LRTAAKKILVHGHEYLCVVKYSASFAGEQLHSLRTSLSQVLQALRRLAKELNKPRARWKQQQIVRKIQRWLSAPFLAELIRYQLEEQAGSWHLQFDFDSAAFSHLLEHRLGRTVLLTNHLDWSAEQVVAGYAGQQSIERVFRGRKDGDWLGLDPMHHWTDRKIRIHAFYCMLGISLLHYRHQQARAGWADLSLEQLLEELAEIKQFVLLYPPQGEKGPARTAYVLSQQTRAQQALVKTLGLERLHRSTPSA
jgi:transposase